MAINGFLIYNITQKNEKIFSSQIKTWVDTFKKYNVKITVIDNLHAFDKVSKAKNTSFVLFWDKDIALMYQLKNLKIKMFNNLDAIRMCDDKAFTFALLTKNNVLTPKTVVLPLTFFSDVLRYYQDIVSVIKSHGIKYPFVVKERCSSLGLGVYLVHNEKEFKSILKEKWQRELIVQQYIGDEFGTDYRVYLINHQPVAVATRQNKSDFRSNVEQGGKMTLINNPSSELLSRAIKASKALNLDFGAVDLVYSKKSGYNVLEVNSNARTATLDRLSKKSLTSEIVKYILSNL